LDTARIVRVPPRTRAAIRIDYHDKGDVGMSRFGLDHRAPAAVRIGIQGNYHPSLGVRGRNMPWLGKREDEKEKDRKDNP